MRTTLIVDPRFNGPRHSGNGGWVAWSLARWLGSKPVSVSLRAPTPLGVPLSIVSQSDGSLTLHDRDTLIAEARLTPLELDLPNPPDWEAAQAAGELARRNAQGSDGPYAH